MFGLGKLKREFEVVKEAVEHLSWVTYHPTTKPVKTFSARHCNLSLPGGVYQGSSLEREVKELQEQVANLREYLGVEIEKVKAVEASTKLVKKDNK